MVSGITGISFSLTEILASDVQSFGLKPVPHKLSAFSLLKTFARQVKETVEQFLLPDEQILHIFGPLKSSHSPLNPLSLAVIIAMRISFFSHLFFRPYSFFSR